MTARMCVVLATGLNKANDPPTSQYNRPNAVNLVGTAEESRKQTLLKTKVSVEEATHNREMIDEESMTAFRTPCQAQTTSRRWPPA